MVQDTAKKIQRLFVAVELPSAVRMTLAKRQKEIPCMLWTSPGNLHLTLRFIGEVSQTVTTAVIAGLKIVRAKPFSLQIQGFGLFDRTPQAILWAGLSPSPELSGLKQQVDSALTQCAGLRNGTGFFTPHVTLGRMKTADLKLLQAFISKANEDNSPAFTVQSFTLFNSVLAPGGAIHSVVERYPLVMSAGTPMRDMQIRSATPADVVDIFNVRCSVKENHLTPEELAALGITPESVNRMICGGDYIVPVALVDRKIAGFAMANILEGYVFALFVQPEYEGLGLGRALMQTLERGLIKRGVSKVWLYTGSEEGTRAPGFYRHLGWLDSGLMEDGQIKFCKKIQ